MWKVAWRKEAPNERTNIDILKEIKEKYWNTITEVKCRKGIKYKKTAPPEKNTEIKIDIKLSIKFNEWKTYKKERETIVRYIRRKKKKNVKLKNNAADDFWGKKRRKWKKNGCDRKLKSNKN